MRLATIIILLSIIQDVCGQNSIITDRPDITESALTVGSRVFQLETGTGIDQQERFNMAGTLIRLGVTDHWELRVEFAPTLSAGSDQDGLQMEDLVIGIKTGLLEQDPHGVDLGLLGKIGLPFMVSESYRTVQPPVSMILLAAKDLGQQLSVGMNAGLSYSGDEQMIYPVSLSAGLSLPYRLGVFLESAVSIRSGQSPLEHIIDGGFTWLVNDDLQVDLSYGSDILSSYWFSGAGISWRITPKD